MEEFLYRLEPARAGMVIEGPTARETEIVGAHFAYLESLTREGRVLLAGRTDTGDARVFGIVVFRAENLAAASALMKADPAVAEGVMRGEVFPFHLALWAPRDAQQKF